MNAHEFYRHLPAIRTSRLYLRKLRMDDAADYFAFARDPLVTRYLRWGPHPSQDATREYLSEVMDNYQKGTDGPWGIEQEERLLGIIHLMDINPVHLKAEVGVAINSQYRGKGFGGEALRAVLEFCFADLSLQRIQGMAIAGNVSACRMMERCGMAHEGHLRRYALQKSQWVDFELYSILAGEVQAGREYAI